MQQIPINAVPSQDLSIQLDGEYWRIKLSLSMEFVCASISRDGTPLISGLRCFVNQPLLPYPYMHEPRFGNFLFDSDVDWNNFGGSCSLYYLNYAEFNQYKELVNQGYADAAIKMLNNRAEEFAENASKINYPTVLVLADIITQPDSVSASAGSDATFIIEAENWVSISWEFASQPGSAWTPIQTLTGGAAETLHIAGVNIHQQGLYRAVVFGDNNTVTSDTVELKVE
ncbi:phage baseplate plug family protein [Citrobacter sp.]|uniref:phage baseplate plug family protein n=1 Tax=Citrobacter sp. TaxID=1896336 RepID=UPI002FC6C532